MNAQGRRYESFNLFFSSVGGRGRGGGIGIFPKTLEHDRNLVYRRAGLGQNYFGGRRHHRRFADFENRYGGFQEGRQQNQTQRLGGESDSCDHQSDFGFYISDRDSARSRHRHVEFRRALHGRHVGDFACHSVGDFQFRKRHDIGDESSV